MRRLLAALGLVAVFGLYTAPLLAPTPAQALTQTELCKGANLGGNACEVGGSGNPTAATADENLKNRIATITNTILYIIGAISVIVLVYGAFRYVSSTGNSTQIQAAKDTIVYAITGLVVALLAYAIVNFVIDRLGG